MLDSNTNETVKIAYFADGRDWVNQGYFVKS